jgi:hypothetical protein
VEQVHETTMALYTLCYEVLVGGEEFKQKVLGFLITTLNNEQAILLAA